VWLRELRVRAIEEPPDNRSREERKLRRRTSRSCFHETTRIGIDERVIQEEARTLAVWQPGLRAMVIREIQECRTRGERKLHRMIQEERAPRVGRTTCRVLPRLRSLAERNPRAELLRRMQLRIVDPHGTARKCFSVRRRRTAVPVVKARLQTAVPPVKARLLDSPVLRVRNRLAMMPPLTGLKATLVEGMAADVVEYRMSIENWELSIGQI